MWNKIIIRATIISQTKKAYLLKNGSIIFFYPKILVDIKNSNYLVVSFQKDAKTKYKINDIEYEVEVEKLLSTLSGRGGENEIDRNKS